MGRVAILLSRSFIIANLSLLILAGATTALAGEAIRINGSGSGLELMKPLMAAYGKSHPDVRFKMEKPLGSSGAIKALLAGAIDIAVTSRPLTPEETARGAISRSFGKTPLAIVTARALPLKTLSTRELEDIYAGRMYKWPNGETIRVILRPMQDIDTQILQGLSPGMAAAVAAARERGGMIVAVTDPEANDAVARTRGGIGASGLTGLLAAPTSLQAIPLNNIAPNLKNLAAGRYPLAKDINFVVTGNLPGAAAIFLRFICSRQGRAIAAKTGVLITARSK